MKSPIKLAGMKLPKPKPVADAIPLARKPMPGGKDIISITTKMRETPYKTGKK